MVPIKAFIQNEAGSNRKNYHNEKTLEYRETKVVSRPYPYPYGFILATTAKDGWNLDVFLITKQPLKSGQIVDCVPIGLMEQFEDGVDDHNVLARLPDETVEITNEIESALTNFVLNVFSHVQGKQIRVGRFLDAQAANAHILANLETTEHA